MDLSDIIQQIKQRVSLVEVAGRYVEFRHQGHRLSAPCPFHQETKPSFFVDQEKGTFYCFGCQASGDLIEFYSRINGLEFWDALKQLADEAGIDIEQRKISRNRKPDIRKDARQMHQEAARHFAGCLAGSSGKECREYIARRGLSSEIIEKFGIGWAERSWRGLLQFFTSRGWDLAVAQEAGLLGKSDNGRFYDRFRGRLMFPIRNLSNQVIAFGGRIIADEEEAKYINSADTPIYSKKEHLYGLCQARRGIVTKGFALLTEGYMDVLTLHQYGFDNGVGVLGTALTEEQIRRLSGFTANVTLVFDGDRAGAAAALRSSEMLLIRGLGCKVVSLPDGEDIDSFLRQAGAQGFNTLCQNAPDGLTYCLNVMKNHAPKEAITWARNFLGQLQIPELASPYASRISQRLGISEQEFREGLTAPSGIRRVPTQANLCERDTQIILYAVRYPHRLEDLRQIGADLALTDPRSRSFWQIIEEYGEDAIYYLDERQKRFWLKQRGPEAAPCTNGDLELDNLKKCLDRFYAQSQLAALEAALSSSANHDFELDLQYLHAVQDTMRKNNE